MSEGFTIQTDVFEGPLDLLLTLIEKRKLFINDVSLARVTDDFISYTEKAKEFPVSESVNFILIASTLLLIKSKSLLPNLALTEEETESIEDLERRLRLYKRMRELSGHFKNRFGKNVLFTRQPTRIRDPIFSPDKHLNISRIEECIRSAIANLPRREVISEAIVKKVVSLEETIERLTERIKGSLKMRFGEFSNSNKTEKIEVIIGFLAMLELVKRGVISVQQDDAFSDILMESDTVGTPKYS